MKSKAVHLWRMTMSFARWATIAVLVSIPALRVTAQAQTPRDPGRKTATTAAAVSPRAELPLKYVGGPTTEAITAADLMTRLYIFADDSMMGREVGTKYNLMGTAYIEREVRRLGLVPAGDNGGYFQNLPLYTTVIDSSSSLSVAGQV